MDKIEYKQGDIDRLKQLILQGKELQARGYPVSMLNSINEKILADLIKKGGK